MTDFCMLCEANLTFYEKFLTLCQYILDFIQTNGTFVLKIIFFFVIGLVIIRLFIKILKKILYKTKLEHAVANYLLTVIRIVAYFVLMFTILKMTGLDTSSLLALFTTISLALSLAMENIFSNFANGLIIIITKPFKEDDWISIGNYEGSVKAIRLLYTVLNTVDNKDINIPNSHFVGNELTNYNANPTRKLIQTYDVSYDSDTEKVKSVLLKCIKSSEYSILEPAPIVRLKSLNESSITFQIIVHCKTAKYWDLYYEMIDKVFNEFKRENISIPFNQLEVRLRDDEVIMPYRKEELTIAKKTEEKKEEKKDIFELLSQGSILKKNPTNTKAKPVTKKVAQKHKINKD